MTQKRIPKIILNFILAGVLVASLSGVALAAPPAQSGNQSTTPNNTALACSQTYVVQPGESLGTIASRFFNNAGAYNQIIQATNAAVGTGGNFTNISDPNLIAPGQTLCIPAPAGATANNVAGGGSNNSPIGPTTTNRGVTNSNNVMFDQILKDNPDKGLLVVENLSGSDIIFDLTQPEPGTAWVGPNQQKEFLLTPDQHEYSGHQPLGDFAIGADQIQVMPGQITWVSCFRNICQLTQSSMLPGQQQSGQRSSDNAGGNSNNNSQ